MPNSAVFCAQGGDLLGRDLVGDRAVDVRGRDVVVLGGDGQFGPADAPTGQAQAFECLRAGHFVDEMQVDVQQIWLAHRRCGAHHVTVPDLGGEGGGGHGGGLLDSQMVRYAS